MLLHFSSYSCKKKNKNFKPCEPEHTRANSSASQLHTMIVRLGLHPFFSSLDSLSAIYKQNYRTDIILMYQRCLAFRTPMRSKVDYLEHSCGSTVGINCPKCPRITMIAYDHISAKNTETDLTLLALAWT